MIGRLWLSSRSFQLKSGKTPRASNKKIVSFFTSWYFPRMSSECKGLWAYEGKNLRVAQVPHSPVDKPTGRVRGSLRGGGAGGRGGGQGCWAAALRHSSLCPRVLEPLQVTPCCPGQSLWAKLGFQATGIHAATLTSAEGLALGRVDLWLLSELSCIARSQPMSNTGRSGRSSDEELPWTTLPACRDAVCISGEGPGTRGSDTYWAAPRRSSSTAES